MRQSLDLFRAFLTRDLQSRYSGSILGLLWYVLNPVFMLSVYTLVFSHIFRIRWAGSADSSTMLFALNVFAGLLVSGFFAEALQRGSACINAQPNLVKRVVFPLMVLPMVVTASSLIHMLVGFSVMLVLVVSIGVAPFAWGSFMLVMPGMFLLAQGAAWIISALTVYIRDMSQVVGLGLSALPFLAPVFYPLSQVPEPIRPWLLLNPITVPTLALRTAVLGGDSIPLSWILTYSACAGVAALFGWWLFRILQRGFADVL